MSTELIDFLQNAGIRNDHPIVAYLTHIGLTSDISFVEFKTDTHELAAWCEKFKSEVTFGDNKIGPMDGDQLAAMKASLIATYKAINRNIESTRSISISSNTNNHTNNNTAQRTRGQGTKDTTNRSVR